MARATVFYQATLEYRRAHPDCDGITALVDESYGLLTQVFDRWVAAGRAI